MLLTRGLSIERVCLYSLLSFVVQVWAALLEKMPMTAMIRNLGKMSAIGLLKPLSSHSTSVCNRLRQEDSLKKARIHPFNVLVALTTYKSGKGDKGKLKWEVNQSIVQALDDAFYMSFKVRNTRFLCFLFVSVKSFGLYIAFHAFCFEKIVISSFLHSIGTNYASQRLSLLLFSSLVC